MAQMRNFFTSEILLLPKSISSLSIEEESDLANKISAIEDLVKSHLASQKEFASVKNISFFNREYANFPIDTVRELQIEAQYSPSFDGQGGRALVLLNFDNASASAQNAALKIIEESPPDTLILLVVSHKERLLETITSRCLLIEPSNPSASTTIAVATTDQPAIPTSLSQAIDLAEKYKDRTQALQLLEELLTVPDMTSQQKSALLQCYGALNRNQNVQLSLENCFFSLVKSSHLN